jgi:16S rRNA G1207 methylase RsmC
MERIWAQAYAARTKDDLRRLYAAWAQTYDRDHEAIGFFGHRLAAETLARHLTRHDVARVLDAGAGTGAAGVALAALGFRDITGVEISFRRPANS